MSRLNIADLYNFKKKQNKIVSIACYTYPIAQIADSICEIILVGDSVGMVLYGMESTHNVSLEMMIEHGKAVTKATNKAFIIIDMPYGTYESDKHKALQNAQRILQETKAQSIKIEGGTELSETIKYLTENNINVVSHIGLTPQSHNHKKDFKIKGKNESEQKTLLQDIKSVSDAGAIAVVIEGVKKEIAEQICQKTDLLTIGIGASDKCDGQILVIDDILGTSNYIPKFAKTYEDCSNLIHKALQKFHNEIKNQEFPSEKNLY